MRQAGAGIKAFIVDLRAILCKNKVGQIELSLDLASSTLSPAHRVPGFVRYDELL